METLVSHEIERKKDGSKIVRNFFFNNDKTNWLVRSQSYFTKDEKKEEKLNYKLSSNNLNKHNSNRMELASYLVKQKSPNWNLKFSLLK